MYLLSIILLAPVAFCNAQDTSSAAKPPLVNIRPPLPILNGSAYSQLAPSGTRPRILSSGLATGAASSASNVATYNGHIFPTLCPQNDTACMDTCNSFVDLCTLDLKSWSVLRQSYQTSRAAGSMPMTTSYHIQTQEATTIWKFETSWWTYNVTTLVEGAGSLGFTTTVVTNSEGKLSISTGLKSGLIHSVFTSYVPVAVGGTGTPVSTSAAHYNTFTFEETSWYDFDVSKPTCSPSSWTDCRYSSDCNRCTISGGTVQLLFFPVPRTGAAPGATSEATLEATPTLTSSAALETAVYKNVTLTSPSVYISFQTAYAQNDCGSQVGERYPGAILPLPLSDLSSVYGGYGTLYSSDPLAPLGVSSRTPYLAAGQFDLADLNWPPPMSAYTNQLKFALGRELFTIMTKPYNPHLAVPSQIRNLDPAWASCGLDWEGLYDPPTALKPAEAEAKPTLPAGEGVHTSARPQSTPTNPAAQTSAPKGTMDFSAPDGEQTSQIFSSAKTQQDPTAAVEESASPTGPENPSTAQTEAEQTPTNAVDGPAPSTHQVHAEDTSATLPGSSVVAFSNLPPPETSAPSKTQQSHSSLKPNVQSVSHENHVDPVLTTDQAVDPSLAPNTPTRFPDEESDVDGDDTNSMDTQLLPELVTPTVSVQADSGEIWPPTGGATAVLSEQTAPIPSEETQVNASEAADESPAQASPEISPSSRKLGTVFLDNTGGANVVLGSSSVAAGKLSTENAGIGPTLFMGTESGTPITRTLQSLQPTSMTEHPQEQSEDLVSLQGEHSAIAPPLMVGIGGQTLTRGGSAQTVSGQVASLGSDELVFGSQTIGIPRIQAGTQRISIPAGSESALMDVTFIAGSLTQPASGSAQAGPKATDPAAEADPILASTVPRAIFSFGTHTYTAIKTFGPSQAVVDGKTLSICGAQVSLEGGSVSLNKEGQLEMEPDPTAAASNGASVARAAAITLDSTILTAVHPSGARKGVVEIGGTTLSPGGSGFVVGDATISALPKGIVTMGDGGSGTVALKKTTLTKETSGNSSSSLSTNGPGSPAVTSGIGYVQTASSSPSSTSGVHKLTVNWLAMKLFLVIAAVIMRP